MPELWYRLLLRAATRIYYRRVRVVRLAPLEIGSGPVLFVGLHRNGAVDGMLYKSIFPRAVFVVARRLLRSWFTRLYFTGIPVTREHDDRGQHVRGDNERSLAAAVDHLASGGHLCILPEGTSDLGPRHLPFKPGAAKVLDAALERGVELLVIPLGIFYESAPAFRSDVCIVVGPPIDTSLHASLPRAGRVPELMARITASLEAIAVEAGDAASLHRIEVLAAVASESLDEGRWRVEKILAGCAPTELAMRWRACTRGVALDRAGVPRVSRHGVLWNACWLVAQLVVVGAATAANVMPVAGAWLASRRLADARNTIALWRIVVGAPLTLAWWMVVAALGILGRWLWVVPAYAGLTALGLAAYPELCVRWPMLRNSTNAVARRRDVRDVRESVLATVAEGSHV